MTVRRTREDTQRRQRDHGILEGRSPQHLQTHSRGHIYKVSTPCER